LTITPQVFFRAGVLGTMEELRDDRLGKIVGWMQAFMRGYLARKDYKKLQEQRWVKSHTHTTAKSEMQIEF
jgi:myosin heavy subunit